MIEHFALGFGSGVVVFFIVLWIAGWSYNQGLDQRK